ncbi:MAG: helix-turn-helix domain-containing protein [Gammaproteobacteria bacterium]
MKPTRPRSLPDDIREAIRQGRQAKGWSQLELGQRVRLAQRHISGIETGKIVPRYDTLLEILRALDHDLVLVPRELIPVVKAIERDYRKQAANGQAEERPLYADRDDEGAT